MPRPGPQFPPLQNTEHSYVVTSVTPGPHDHEVSAVNDIQTKGTGFRMSDLEAITKNAHEDCDTCNESSHFP